jgi:hypothetical protein
MMRAFVFLTTSATFMLMNFSFTIIDANSDSSFVNQQYLDQTNDWEFIGTPTGNFSISTWKVSQLLYVTQSVPPTNLQVLKSYGTIES